MPGFSPTGSSFNPETAISVDSARHLTRLWSVPTRTGGALMEGVGTVAVGGQALDAKTGTTRWQSPDNSPFAFGIVGDTVFQSVYRQLDQPLQLRAVDVHTGAVKWSRDTFGNPLMVAGGLLLEGGGGTHGAPPELDVSDLRSGAFLWGTGLDNSPTVGNGLVYNIWFDYYGTNRNYLHAYEAKTGKLRWESSAACPAGATTLPVVANGKVYSTGRTFDAASGKLLWNWPICPGGLSSVSVSPRLVFVSYMTAQNEARLAAFGANTGTLEWSIPFAERPGNQHDFPKGQAGGAPAIENGVLFATEANSLDGSVTGSHLVALAASTGARLWSSPHDPAAAYWNAPIVANGIVYAGASGWATDFHRVDAFRADGG
jgi:outer membrane protein assembly factor BamB